MKNKNIYFENRGNQGLLRACTSKEKPQLKRTEGWELVKNQGEKIELKNVHLG